VVLSCKAPVKSPPPPTYQHSLKGLLFMQPIKPRWACLEHIIHVEMVNPNPNLSLT